MAESQQLSKLRKMFDNRCHYCDVLCNSHRKSPQRATREHVVPKSFGGSNSMKNYVLACSRCNNNRGTKLWFCRCDTCTPLIEAALASQSFYDRIFAGMVVHNRPKVKKYNNTHWVVKYGYNSQVFLTWDDAMTFVNESEECNGFSDARGRL